MAEPKMKVRTTPCSHRGEMTIGRRSAVLTAVSLSRHQQANPSNSHSSGQGALLEATATRTRPPRSASAARRTLPPAGPFRSVERPAGVIRAVGLLGRYHQDPEGAVPPLD